MSKMMSENERQQRLYCTPSHVTKALLKRERFPGSIWEPAAGKGHIVDVLQQCACHDVRATDINDWGFALDAIEDFLTSTHRADCIITNPPYHSKFDFLAQAKRLARRKIAMLMPVDMETTMTFVRHHQRDHDFPLKAIYGLPQAIPWENVTGTWGKQKHAWFVFERGYRGQVLREQIVFQRNKTICRGKRAALVTKEQVDD